MAKADQLFTVDFPVNQGGDFLPTNWCSPAIFERINREDAVGVGGYVSLIGER